MVILSGQSLAGRQEDTSDMALCVRCGQQTETGAEICSDCGGRSYPDEPSQPMTARAMAGASDYLRPFAAEGTGPTSLPDNSGPNYWTDPGGHPVPAYDEQSWYAPSPSGQPPDFSLPGDDSSSNCSRERLDDIGPGSYQPGPADERYAGDADEYAADEWHGPERQYSSIDLPEGSRGGPWSVSQQASDGFAAARLPTARLPLDDSPSITAASAATDVQTEEEEGGRRWRSRRSGRPAGSRAFFDESDVRAEEQLIDQDSVGGPGRGRWISVAAATVVLVIAAAGAAILLSHHGKTGGHATAGHTAPASSPAPTPSTGTTASVSSKLIAVKPAAATSPRAPAVVAFLTRYFTAINHHDYAAYRMLFSRRVRGQLSASAFATGYGTSRDSHMTLRSLATQGSGPLIADVTFTSHQQPAASPTNSSCNHWTISLYLARRAHGYVLVSPPSDYGAKYLSC